MKTPSISFTAETAPDFQPFYHVRSLGPKTFKDISALAHEVRNPLTNINLAIEMLELVTGGDDRKVYLDIIKRSSVRINLLIADLLKYQQLEEIQAEKHSIEELLDEVISMARDRISLKHVIVRKDYALHDCQIALNRQKVKIALTNIIINALDAMPPTGGELKLLTQTGAGKYMISIEDNGCGISEADLANIFKPFFTGKPGGLGIGLATTYDILVSNRIGLTVESEEGMGTIFTLLFDTTYDIGNSL
jgi:signal transduction histidine kinase